MNATRRSLLKAFTLGGAASLTSCERLTTALSQQLGQGVPSSLTVGDGVKIDDDFHLLNRASFGPWPGDLQKLKSMGREGWVEAQLQPESIDDTLCDLRTGAYESLQFEPGNAYEFKKEVLRDEITRHTLIQSVYSKRQLLEVMVEFWTDHLNIDLEKGDCVYLKPSDDRDVIRAHALGNFHDLILASAKSPAMLTYLDGRDNKVRRHTKDVPNENYARELMELHTLGVSGGYTQDDVREAARCLTGWTVDLKRKMLDDLNLFKPARGVTYFKKEWHDDGEKKVLGQTIVAGGGAQDIERLVEIVCTHPSTARYLATKLCHRLVSYNPPEALVQRVADKFTAKRGDIKSLLRVILQSEEFYASQGQLLKRPFRYIVSALRTVGADTYAHPPLMDYLHRMGQGLFQYPTPDGYPDEEAPWMGTLLWRWNFAFALASNQVPTVKCNPTALRKSLDKDAQAQTAKLFAHCIGRHPLETELQAIQGLTDKEEMLGAMLASPAFQRC